MNCFVRVSGYSKVIDVIFSFESLIIAILLPAGRIPHGCSVSQPMFIHDSIRDNSQKSAEDNDMILTYLIEFTFHVY
jgi:hypothetical protein